MRFIVLILLVALLASLGTYAVLNVDEQVDVTLPWIDLRGVPQIYLVLAALLSGAFFMGVLSLVDGIRLRLANRRLQKEIDHLRDDVRIGQPSEPEPEVEPRRRGPFRGALGKPATRPQIPSAGSSSGSDDPPPYGI
jgi:uncharacterized integral membrane protein